MRVKFGILALLVVGLVLCFGTVSQAEPTVAVTAGDVANTPAAGDSFVAAAFKVTADAGGDVIYAFKYNTTGLVTIANDADVVMVSIYEDVNADGAYDSGDTRLYAQTASPGAIVNGAAGDDITYDVTNITLEANEAKDYYILVTLADQANNVLLFDGLVLDGTVNVTIDAGGGEPVAGDQPVAADTVTITASHLQWQAAGFEAAAALGSDLLDGAGGVGTDLLYAVDDYGNVDVDFVEAIKLSAAGMTTGSDITASLTATGGSPAVDITSDGGTAATAFAAGVIKNQTGAATASGITTLAWDDTNGLDVAVTVIAKSVGTNLEGSTTINCHDGTMTIATGLQSTRGIEVYDTDHNGMIDHMTVVFNGPVQFTGLTVNHFAIAGGYVATGIVGDGTGTDNAFDAGGTGIRNVGDYGVTLILEESGTYDTNVKPDFQFKTQGAITARQGGGVLPTILSAVEVDKARPVMLSATTADLGYGGQTASNGVLDGVVFEFSEPVQSVTAGTDSTGNALYIDPVHAIVFTSDGTISGNTVVIPIGETSINTGLSPTVYYNLAHPVTDNATAATGAPAKNIMFPNKNDYSVDSAFTARDGAPMVVFSVTTKDTDTNGLLDKIEVTFSENVSAATNNGVSFQSSVSAFSSRDLANGIYEPDNTTPTPPVITGSKVTFTIDENTVEVYDTEALPVFLYNTTDGNILDSNGVELQAYGPGGLEHPATVDGAPPAIVKVVTGDAVTDTARVGGSGFESTGANGRIDNVKVIFSEQVKTTAGAENGGTALDNTKNLFTVTYPVVGARTKIATTEAIGAPVWEDKDTSGDTSSELTIYFQEVSKATASLINGGDTGVIPTVTYDDGTVTNYKIRDLASITNFLADKTVAAGDPEAVDGAKPFLVDDMFKNWGDQAKASVLTYDKNEFVTGGRHHTPAEAEDADDNGNGDGYLDGFMLKFTENVVPGSTAVSAANLKAFTIDITTGGALTFNNANALFLSTVSPASTAAANTWYLLGNVTESKGDPDTDMVPTLSFNANVDIQDATGNKLAAFEDKAAYDGAPPVIVGVNGGDTLTELDFTFSEPVYAHDADGNNVSFNSVTTLSSTLFGYQNLSTGAGASGFTSAAVTQPSDRVLRATINYDLQVADIEADLVWPRTEKIYDNANDVDPDLDDNVTDATTSGANLKINIMDDVIAPWIISIGTVDFNANGKVDHLRFQFSENIDDSTLSGYIDEYSMTDDVSAIWQVSNYNGTAMWNVFDKDDNDARAAALAAEQPIFADNDKDDDILYLRLEEDMVPMNSLNGEGSTDFQPTITWGAFTLGDFRPNLLDTANNKDDYEPDAVGGTVTDEARPTIAAAVWNPDSQAPAAEKVAATGGYVTVYFSEEIKHAGKAVYAEYFDFTLSAEDNMNLVGYTWLDNATLELAIKSDETFAKDGSESIQVKVPQTGGVTNWPQWEDVDDNPGLYKGQVLNNASVSDWYNGGLVEASSPMSSTPYPYKANTVGNASITNTAYLVADGITDSVPHAGESVRFKWKYRTAAEALFDQVEVYVSYNQGESYVLVEGSQTPVADKLLYWTATMGVTNVKVQAVGFSDYNFSYGVSVVYDGTNSGGSSIGAPADLTIMDVPDDNGGFVIAQFTVSAEHLVAVNSYQFYREVALDAADPNNMTMVEWCAVEAAAPDDNNKQTVIIPTIWDGASTWAVRASTGSVISGATAAAKTAEVVLSDAVMATGASIDNIAPSAPADFAVTSADGGVMVSWAEAADHGVVSEYTFRGATQYIYGVESYDVYRSELGADSFELVGSAEPGSVSYIDPVGAGSTVYTYYVMAVDSSNEVASAVRSGIATSPLKGDFTGDATINASDFSIFAANYGKVAEGNEATYVWAYDLNTDGKIDASDFSIFAAAYGSTLEAAKAAVAEMPASDIPFGISATVDDVTSSYIVNVNIGQTQALKGFEFFLSYNTEAFEFVQNSTSGLVGLTMLSEVEDGIIRVSDWFVGNEFDGTVSMTFRSTGVNSTSTFEIMNAVVDVDGLAQATDVAEFEARALPTVYSLSQNYPNPFNPTTTIDYSLPKNGSVELVIYNTSGQKVRSLVTGAQNAGFYKIVWDGRNDYGESVASGVYIYKLVSGSFNKTAKMNLIK